LPHRMRLAVLVSFRLDHWSEEQAPLPATVEDLARTWGVSVQTIYNLRRRAICCLQWRVTGGRIACED
jgi:hypothetical protein